MDCLLSFSKNSIIMQLQAILRLVCGRCVRAREQKRTPEEPIEFDDTHDSRDRTLAARRVLGIPELSGMIFSQLPDLDLRYTQEVCSYFRDVITTDPKLRNLAPLPPRLWIWYYNKDQIAHGSYSILFHRIFPVSRYWRDFDTGGSLATHSVCILDAQGNYVRMADEPYYIARAEVYNAVELAALRAELQTFPQDFRGRQISLTLPVTTMKTRHTSSGPPPGAPPTETFVNPDGFKIGDLLDAIDRCLATITTFSFSLQTLQVLFMGPMVCVHVGGDTGLCEQKRLLARGELAGIPYSDMKRRYWGMFY